MKILFWFLTYLYSILMLIAIYSYYEGTDSWLMFLNVTGSLLVFFTPIQRVFLYSGLFILLLAAICNGFFVFGRIRLSHVVVRFIFSIFLIALYECFVTK